MASFQFYGKKTCVTCQKAKAFLEANGVDFAEHPIETQPPTRAVLESLVDADNVKASLNIRSTLYKTHNMGQAVPEKRQAIDWMLQDPNLIKRPVLIDAQGRLYQGFDELTLRQFLQEGKG